MGMLAQLRGTIGGAIAGAVQGRRQAAAADAITRLGLPAELKTALESWVDAMFRTGMDSSLWAGRSVTDPYSQDATFYRAVNAMAKNIARVPIELFRKGSDVVVEDHPLQRVLQVPNALMRGTQLIEALVCDWSIDGNALWLVGDPVRQPRGEMVPSSIRRLDPSRTKVKLDKNDEPELYTYRVNGEEKKFPAEKVVHFKKWDPADETWGMGWSRPASDEIENDWYMKRWNRNFFRRGGEPGVILKPEGERNISEPNAERLKQAFINQHIGFERAWAPAVLPVGMTVERSGIGQRDMDFVAGRRYSRENLLSASGVPPAIAGILEYANYANMGPQLKLFYYLEVIPLIEYLQSVMQVDLLDRQRIPLDIYFKTEELNALIEDLGAKTEIAKGWFAMGVPVSELNDRLEMGFDLSDMPAADESFLSYGLVRAEDIIAGSTFATPPDPGQQGTTENTDQAQQDPEKTDPEKANALRLIGTKRYHRPQLGAIWRALVGYTKDLESLADSRWRSHLKSLEADTLAAVAALFPKAAAGPRPVQKDETAPKDPRAQLTFNLVEANQEVIIQLEPVWRASMARGANTVAQQLNMLIDFSFVDPKVLAALANRRQEIRQVNERIAADLRETLAEGLGLGESEADLKARVNDFFGGERANSRTVARTETFGPFSEGRFAAMGQAGVKRHSWLTAEDTRVRDSHEAIDGQEVLIGDSFGNGLRYPHDPAGGAGEVINCRCVTLPVVA